MVIHSFIFFFPQRRLAPLMDYGVEFDLHKYLCTPSHYAEAFAAAVKIAFRFFVGLWHRS